MTAKHDLTPTIVVVAAALVLAPMTGHGQTTVSTETARSAITTSTVSQAATSASQVAKSPVGDVKTTPAPAVATLTPTPVATATPVPETTPDHFAFTLSSPGIGTTRTLEGGVKIQDLRSGSGPATTGTEIVYVHYEAYLANGKKVDDSRTQLIPVPLKFRFEQRQTVQGFEEGIKGMQVGGVRRIYVPSKLAYGSEDHGIVPANSNMYFIVELVRREKPKPVPTPPPDKK